MRREQIVAGGVALVATLALAVPATAQQVDYDNGSFELLQKETTLAQEWGTGAIDDYNAPKVTYTGAPIVLRASLHTPPVAWTSKVWQWQFDALERMSGGKIKVEHRWSGTIHPVNKGFEAVRDNLTDVTGCWSFYKANSFPMMQGLFLPGISPNAAVHSLMAETLYDKYFRAEYERQGTYLSRLRATTPYILWTKKPVGKLEDLKGMKVRSGGGTEAKVLAALGATPTSMASTEIYTAFQRGIVDAVSISDGAAEIFKVHEIATHRSYFTLVRIVLEQCIRPEWINALPADLRAVYDHWGRAAAQYDTQMSYVFHGAKAREEVFRDKFNMKFITIAPQEEARWKKAVEPVIDEFIADGEKAGLPAKQLVADMRATVEKIKGMSPNQIFAHVVKNPVKGILPKK